MLKGFLMIMNGNCKRDLEGIYYEFIPTTEEEKAREYVKGNGDIISCVPYSVHIGSLTDKDRYLLLDRIANLT